MNFRPNKKHATFNACQSMRHPKDMHVVFVIDTVDEDALVSIIKEA